MPKLYSSWEIELGLQKLGFSFISQKGSPGKFKNSAERVVILPMHKREIPTGTFKSILRQMGITQKILKNCLEGNINPTCSFSHPSFHVVTKGGVSKPASIINQIIIYKLL